MPPPAGPISTAPTMTGIWTVVAAMGPMVRYPRGVKASRKMIATSIARRVIWWTFALLFIILFSFGDLSPRAAVSAGSTAHKIKMYNNG